MGNYTVWNEFNGDAIPSSLDTYPLLYQMLRPGEKIIDIGCGYGKTCFELAEKDYGPIWGIDINESGIAHANKMKQNLGYPEKMTFDVRDALKTGYSDHYFDAGIMQAFMTTLTTPEHRITALKEARRIIRDGGGLYMAVFMQTWHNRKMRERYEQGVKDTGELGSFQAINQSTGKVDYVAHHYSEKEIVYLLLEAGFEIDTFQYHIFTTRSGNKVNGGVIWVE